MNRLLRRALPGAFVTVVLSACASRPPAAGSSPAATPSAPPIPAELALKIERDLLACDAGEVAACSALGKALFGAKHFDSALAAFDHGCHLGTRAKASDRDNEPCELYREGEPCDPAFCEQCNNGTAEGEEAARCRAFAGTCSARDRACKEGSLATCLDLAQARLCVEAARVYTRGKENELLRSGTRFCSAEHRAVYERAAGFAVEACERYRASAARPNMPESVTAFCGESENVDRMFSWCAETERNEEAARRRREAARAEMLASFARSVTSTAGTFVAGAAPSPTTPRIVVNAESGTQWSSPSLAFIATRMPAPPAGRAHDKPSAKAPSAGATAPSSSSASASASSVSSPGPGPGGEPDAHLDAAGDQACLEGCAGRCSREKTACGAGTMRACYLASACLCRCAKELGCGGAPDALSRCVAENESKARQLGSDATTVDPTPRGHSPSSGASKTPPLRKPAKGGRVDAERAE